MDLKSADEKAAKVVEILAPMCEQIAVAGSIRRRRPQVGDIDLVIQPKAGRRAEIKATCMAWKPMVLTDGNMNFLFILKSVQIDIFFADEAGGDLFCHPSNFGTLLVCRTGSKEFNVWLATEAKKNGVRWNPYRGVVCRGQVVASAKEEDVFAAIGVPFLDPKEREK
jgi:DNA polymerase (family 10)